MGAKVLKCRLPLRLGIFWRSRYRLSTQVEMLYVLAIPAPQRILGGISQLANGRVKPLAKPDIEFNRSKSVCVGIHELPPWWSKFSSASPGVSTEKMGVFTPTEAGVVAAVYALFVFMVVYREMTFAQLYRAFADAARTSAVVMFLVAAAAVSAWLITVANIPQQVISLLEPLIDSPILLMAAIMFLVMLVGTALDLSPTILILVPVLMPLVKTAGIDPVYFGVLFMINCAIGLITPPVGVVLNTVAGVGRISMDRVVSGVMPFMVAQFALVLLLVLFPQLVTVPARWFY